MGVGEMLCSVCLSAPLGLLPHREENTATEVCTLPLACLATVVMGLPLTITTEGGRCGGG